jgi:hypothetical protein
MTQQVVCVAAIETSAGPYAGQLEATPRERIIRDTSRLNIRLQIATFGVTI